MASLQSLLDDFESAASAIPAAALATPTSPSFIGADTISVPAGGFSTIYAFGDSLSDAGNVSIATLGAVPQAPYSDGRFSNGNVWVQDLAQNLGMPVLKPSLAGGTDYAYGGAETGPTAVHTVNPTDLPSQVAQFAANTPNPSPNALYTVWMGSNDVLDIANSGETATQQQQSVQQAVTNETASIDALIAHGAKDLVVLDVPNLSKTPYEMARPTSDAASGTLAQQYNTDLGAALQAIVASGAASIDYVDTYSLLDKVIASPATYGLTNVTQPLWNGTLTNPQSGTLAATGPAQNGYLFFDDLHPSAAGHALLADGVTQSLTGQA
ncbi:MAG TPA: SGNH/GDSL hydrolase family protein [Rhodopila sp.]|jgi:phospholipase/lecithinase/hemolysin|nr:SGNH/GDSL hydrolase family protein [Rhodopila sp.]